MPHTSTGIAPAGAAPALQAIGLEPKSHDEYVLADGTALTMDTTVAQIEFQGKTVGGRLHSCAYGD